MSLAQVSLERLFYLAAAMSYAMLCPHRLGTAAAFSNVRLTDRGHRHSSSGTGRPGRSCSHLMALSCRRLIGVDLPCRNASPPTPRRRTLVGPRVVYGGKRQIWRPALDKHNEYVSPFALP